MRRCSRPWPHPTKYEVRSAQGRGATSVRLRPTKQSVGVFQCTLLPVQLQSCIDLPLLSYSKLLLSSRECHSIIYAHDYRICQNCTYSRCCLSRQALQGAPWSHGVLDDILTLIFESTAGRMHFKSSSKQSAIAPPACFLHSALLR